MFGLGWLFGSRASETDRILASNDLEEADFAYAGTADTELRRETVDYLNEMGHEITELRPSHIENVDGELYVNGTQASELEDLTVFYRQKSFLSGLEGKEEAEALRNIQRLKEDYGWNFVNSPHGADIADNKKQFKRFIEPLVQDLDGVELPETYDTYEEMRETVDEDDQVVVKTEEGSQGDGVEIGSLDEFTDFGNDQFGEEYVDHYDTDAKDLRLWRIGDEILGAERVMEDDRKEPKNLNNDDVDTYYESLSDEDISTSAYSAAYLVSEAIGIDVGAIDMVQMEDGSVKVLEANPTAGTQINEVLGPDLYGVVGDELISTRQQNLKRLEAREPADYPSLQASAV